jgi:hypothetical protein
MKITRQQPMRREILRQDIEELHQSRRDIFRIAQIWRERDLAPQFPYQAVLV